MRLLTKYAPISYVINYLIPSTKRSGRRTLVTTSFVKLERDLKYSGSIEGSEEVRFSMN